MFRDRGPDELCTSLLYVIKFDKNASVVKRSVQELVHNVKFTLIAGPFWPRLYGSWIYNYLCNQCLSPLTVVSSNPSRAR